MRRHVLYELSVFRESSQKPTLWNSIEVYFTLNMAWTLDGILHTLAFRCGVPYTLLGKKLVIMKVIILFKKTIV